jgi:hypothetical protein
MKNAVKMFCIAAIAFSAIFAGCSGDCEVECRNNGTTYRNTMSDMSKSECEGLNEHASDSCTYTFKGR